jgi:hypothetical protein
MEIVLFNRAGMIGLSLSESYAQGRNAPERELRWIDVGS